MKKTLLVIICLLSFWTKKVDAQITLDFEIDTIAFGTNEFYCIDISNSESKYIYLNERENKFSLYNLDMSVFIENIKLPIGDSLKNGFVVMYVTRSLFDCDSTNIEFAYSSPFNSDRKPFRVLRTDGNILLEVDSARGPYHFGGGTGGSIIISPIKNTSEGTKLFLDILNPSNKGIKVYSLCGELPLKYNEIVNSKEYVKVYPNPSNTIVNVELVSNAVQDDLEFIIYSYTGAIIEKLIIEKGSKKKVMNVANYNNGAYVYALLVNNQLLQNGKLIINR
jgi:hypothetical protein